MVDFGAGGRCWISRLLQTHTSKSHKDSQKALTVINCACSFKKNGSQTNKIPSCCPFASRVSFQVLTLSGCCESFEHLVMSVLGLNSLWAHRKCLVHFYLFTQIVVRRKQIFSCSKHGFNPSRLCAPHCPAAKLFLR